MILQRFKYGFIGLLLVMATVTSVHHMAVHGKGLHSVDAHHIAHGHPSAHEHGVHKHHALHGDHDCHDDHSGDVERGEGEEICVLSTFAQAEFASLDVLPPMTGLLVFDMGPGLLEDENRQNQGGRPYPARGPPMSFA